MSGWGPQTPSEPDGQPPRTYWSRGEASDALGPGTLVRRALRLYRSAPRPFLLVAVVPELIRDLLAIPSFLIALGFIEAFVPLFQEYLALAAANSADPYAIQTAFEEQLRAVLVPPPDLASWSAILGAGGVVAGLVGASALTAVALGIARGRPVSPGHAFAAVARGALIKPIVALGIGWLIVSWLPLLLQTSPEFQAWAGVPGSARSILLGSLLSVAAVVVGVAIVIVAVRWALYIPVAVAEPLGVGLALARSAELSRGIRTRLALAMVGVLLLHSLSVGLVSLVVGVAIGTSVGSVAIGFGAYLATSLVGNLLWAPVLPALLSLAYETRIGEVPNARS